MPQITVVDATTGTVTERTMTAAEAAAYQSLQAAAAMVSTAAQDRKIEQLAAFDELSAQYAAGMARLDDIVANGGTFTNVQVRDAVVDLARIQRRTLRALRTFLGG